MNHRIAGSRRHTRRHVKLESRITARRHSKRGGGSARPRLRGMFARPSVPMYFIDQHEQRASALGKVPVS